MQQMSVLRNPIPISKETIHLCLNIYLQKHNACCSGGYSHKIPGQVVPRPMGIVLKAKGKKKKKIVLSSIKRECFKRFLS